MRRPRAGDERTPKLPGGAGVPPGGTTTPRARSSLTAGRQACPRLEGAAAQKGPRPRAEGSRSGTQEARPGAVMTLRWRAERRHTFARRGDLQPNDAPIGAPSPRFLRGTEREYGVPGAFKE